MVKETSLNSTTAPEGAPYARRLSELLGDIRSLLSSASLGGWVVAEISQIGGSRHLYVDLVERDDDGAEVAKAKGVIWSGARERIVSAFRAATGSDLRAGVKVMLRVSVSFHVQYGLSLVIEDVDPSYTVGDMQRKLEAIRKALADRGISGNNRRLPSPGDFTRVAVVSPADAAGLGDFKSQADVLQSLGLCAFEYFPATFQGADAPSAIVQSLRRVFDANRTTRYDAVVIIRGGGAAADLAWLNDLHLVEAVCLMPIPVFSGIGHERDSVLIDEFAQASFHTPSKVIAMIQLMIVANAKAGAEAWAGLLTGANKAVELAGSRIDASSHGIAHRAVAALAAGEASITALLTSVSASSHRTLDVALTTINGSVARIPGDARSVIASAGDGVQTLIQSVLGMGPESTMRRGFAIARTMDGKAISTAKAARHELRMRISFIDGEVGVANEDFEF